MKNFTIHIFGYGETQINSKDLSVKVKTNSLTNVVPLIAKIFTKKPADSTAIITEFYAINLFNYDDVQWMSKQGFYVKKDVDFKTLIDNLIAELQTAKDSQLAPATKIVKV